MSSVENNIQDPAHKDGSKTSSARWVWQIGMIAVGLVVASIIYWMFAEGTTKVSPSSWTGPSNPFSKPRPATSRLRISCYNMDRMLLWPLDKKEEAEAFVTDFTIGRDHDGDETVSFSFTNGHRGTTKVAGKWKKGFQGGDKEFTKAYKCRWTSSKPNEEEKMARGGMAISRPDELGERVIYAWSELEGGGDSEVNREFRLVPE